MVHLRPQTTIFDTPQLANPAQEGSARLTRGMSTPQSSPPTLQFICSRTFCTTALILLKWPMSDCALMTCGREKRGWRHPRLPRAGSHLRGEPLAYLGGHWAVHAAQLLDGGVQILPAARDQAEQQLHLLLPANTAQGSQKIQRLHSSPTTCAAPPLLTSQPRTLRMALA